MVQIIVDVRKRLVRRFAMQLCLNFNKRMVYSNTEQTVRDGDVVHLNNKPYFISEVDVDAECVVLVRMDERQLHREVPCWQIKAHVN